MITIENSKSLTFEEFKYAYKHRPYKLKWYWGLIPGRKVYSPQSFEPSRKWLPEFKLVLFELRFLVPDKDGFITNGGESWCWPWQWYRKYYDKRYGNDPNG